MKLLRIVFFLTFLSTPALTYGGVIIAGISTTDIGTPTTYGFSVTRLVAPTINGLASISASFSGSCTDSGSDGCSATIFNSALVELFVNHTTLVGAFVPTLTGGAGTTTPFGPLNFSSSFDCGSIGGCTSHTLSLAFTGSGSGDSYSFDSSYIITAAVPEPESFVLLSLGLLVLGLARRKNYRR